MIIFKDAEKVFDKAQHLFSIKRNLLIKEELVNTSLTW